MLGGRDTPVYLKYENNNKSLNSKKKQLKVKI